MLRRIEETRPGRREPFKLIMISVLTDTRDAILLDVATGREIGRGLRAIPRYAELAALAAPMAPLPDDVLARERRILFAYSEFLSGGCCQGACRPKARM